MGKQRRAWGKLVQLPSGNWRASYIGPDDSVHSAPTTYLTKMDAEVWLGQEKRLIDAEEWRPPRERAKRQTSRGQTFGDFATTWLANRQVKGRPLKPRTRDHYQDLMDRFILPEFRSRPLPAITSDEVDAWYRELGDKTPTYRAHAYSLLRTILGSVDPAVLPNNPARIRGAGSTTRRHEIEPLTLDELATLVGVMPEKRRLMVLLAAWCALRFGELTELRRRDIDVANTLVKVRRGVVRGGVVGDPKSSAGARNVAIPPHLMPLVKEHLKSYAEPGRDGLLFPGAGGKHLAPSTLYGRAPKKVKTPDGKTELRGGHGFYRARAMAGRPQLHFHDLRHTGAVLAAQTGATLAELMARLGHSTPAAAMRYQHAAKDRDKQIAEALSRMAQPAP